MLVGCLHFLFKRKGLVTVGWRQLYFDTGWQFVKQHKIKGIRCLELGNELLGSHFHLEAVNAIIELAVEATIIRTLIGGLIFSFSPGTARGTVAAVIEVGAPSVQFGDKHERVLVIGNLNSVVVDFKVLKKVHRHFHV